MLIVCTFRSYGQEYLSLQAALDKALQYNFDIRLAENDLEQAVVNNIPGNAGLLPDINATGGVTMGNSNTRMEFVDGRVQEVNSANSVSYNAGLSVSYTLFAGGRSWTLRQQLKDKESLASVALQAQIQSVVSQTIQAYAHAVWKQQQRIAIDSALSLARTRMILSQLQYETGSAAKVNFLQARVDYNARRSDSLAQVSELNTALAALNVLMGEDPFKYYRVDDSLSLQVALEPIDKDLLYDRNLQIEMARRNLDLSKQDEKIARTYLYPSLNFNGNYNFTRTQSQAGFALFNQSYGPSGGLSVNIPIFQGGNGRRLLKTATLATFRQQLNYDRQQTEIGRQYRQAWLDYQMSAIAYTLESQNIELAHENLEIQKVRFRIGVANTLEMREAENSYVEALMRLYTAAYQLKIQETRVLELDNRLVSKQ